MSRTFQQSCLVIMTAAIASICLSPVSAQERESNGQLPFYSDRDRDILLAQVTSISQFRDVTPGNWAFGALQNLVEEEGCVVGYPDRTYRGDRAMTRNEFAAGMNACMQALERRLSQTEQPTTTTQAQTETETTTTANATQEPLAEEFERAFFHNMDSFYESIDPFDQINTQLGIYPFKIPAAFPENQIARDAELLNGMYKDALQQQSSLPNVRTRDLPNPFNTSLQENPAYLRGGDASRREVIINRE
jgi:hypothetical protein